MRKTLYSAVTDHSYLMGGKTPFDFKFIPQLNTQFGKETDLSETQGNQSLDSKRTLERVFFAIFLLAIAFGVLVAYALFLFGGYVFNKVDGEAIWGQGLSLLQ